jgi:hypothetical protein
MLPSVGSESLNHSIPVSQVFTEKKPLQVFSRAAQIGLLLLVTFSGVLQTSDMKKH